MRSILEPIHYDFRSGAFAGAKLVDRTGLEFMRLAANLTNPIEFVGFSIFAKLARATFPSKRPIQAKLSNDTLFEFPYGDAYWGRLLDNSQNYTPNITNFLKRISPIDYAFIDCGANFGYMSALVSGRDYGSKPAIAIEADSNSFLLLKRNQQLNGLRFDILHNAVFSKSGEVVNMHGTKHEARSILPDNGEISGTPVITLKLDELASWYKNTRQPKLLLKLDVEGVEIEAIKGATELIKNDTLIMFECHGNDPSHEVTRHFMQSLNMPTFFPDKAGCKRLERVEDLNEIKRNRRIGYDLLATSDPFWLEKLESYSYSKMALSIDKTG